MSLQTEEHIPVLELQTYWYIGGGLLIEMVNIIFKHRDFLQDMNLIAIDLNMYIFVKL